MSISLWKCHKCGIKFNPTIVKFCPLCKKNKHCEVCWSEKMKSAKLCQKCYDKQRNQTEHRKKRWRRKIMPQNPCVVCGKKIEVKWFRVVCSKECQKKNKKH